eukprot:2467050-Prymnesium_polylepis.1
MYRDRASIVPRETPRDAASESDLRPSSESCDACRPAQPTVACCPPAPPPTPERIRRGGSAPVS